MNSTIKIAEVDLVGVSALSFVWGALVSEDLERDVYIYIYIYIYISLGG